MLAGWLAKDSPRKQASSLGRLVAVLGSVIGFVNKWGLAFNPVLHMPRLSQHAWALPMQKVDFSLLLDYLDICPERESGMNAFLGWVSNRESMAAGNVQYIITSNEIQ